MSMRETIWTELNILEAIIGRPKPRYRPLYRAPETANHSQASSSRSSRSVVDGCLLIRRVVRAQAIRRTRCFSTIGSHTLQIRTPYSDHIRDTVQPANIESGSSEAPGNFTEKTARQNFVSLVGERSHLLKDPLAFFERILKRDRNWQLQLRTTYNAGVFVKCVAVLSHAKGWKISALGRDDDKGSAENAASLALLSQLFEEGLLVDNAESLDLNLKSRGLSLSERAMRIWQQVYGAVNEHGSIPKINITIKGVGVQDVGRDERRDVDFTVEIASRLPDVKVVKNGSGSRAFRQILADAATQFGRKIRNHIDKVAGTGSTLARTKVISLSKASKHEFICHIKGSESDDYRVQYRTRDSPLGMATLCTAQVVRGDNVPIGHECTWFTSSGAHRLAWASAVLAVEADAELAMTGATDNHAASGCFEDFVDQFDP